MVWCRHTIAGGGFVSVDYTIKGYQDLVESYANEPRDVRTIPLDREPIWFFTYVENSYIYVRPARLQKPSSRMRAPRRLNPAEFNIMLDLYIRRKCGQQVSADAKKASQNQVYWYGVFRDVEMKNMDDAVSRQFPNNKYSERKEHSRLPFPADNKHLYEMDNPHILKVLGYEFQFIQQLIPECENGQIKEYAPQNKYAKRGNLLLARNGSGTFCRFSIQAPTAPGVYLWVVAGEIIYIGEAVNLSKRFNSGYGNISPRNCYIGGQSTNCKMNKVVLEYYRKGQVIDLYFLPTEDHKQTELFLLQRIHTKYNVKDN